MSQALQLVCLEFFYLSSSIILMIEFEVGEEAVFKAMIIYEFHLIKVKNQD